jgi:exopolyphosphatase/guanosine-5'-triphosphate,3'-diphosphate pyrophosphatase
MRIAVVDVGSNTSRLFLAEVQNGRVTQEILRLSRVTRLGAGVDASGRLSEAALEREHTVLAEYTTLLSPMRCERRVAVMTSAVRDATNGPAFAQTVAERYDLEAHVLGGDEEARLTYRGATDGTGPADTTRILVSDIGGGSTELVLGRGTRADFAVSTQAGVVRQADRHITSDPPDPTQLAALAADVRATLAAGVPEARRGGVERAIAVAGTATSLAAITLELAPYDPARIQGYTLTREVVADLRTGLAAMPQAERQRLPGLHPDRAPVIVPGAIILEAVMDLFGLAQVEVSEHDILRGAAVYYAGA